ncbi:zyxin-like isoform X1 [Pelobates fuscus]|uniref:zyxin-like isoform X1 n=2 Tax=Pelobates fuscus TaxID=191477 RepID=UPI002FE4C78A
MSPCESAAPPPVLPLGCLSRSHSVCLAACTQSLILRDFKMDPAAPATRMTSSFTINISTPSFYNPPKKFAPVVPPKPKVNPFKASDEPEPPHSSVGPQEHSAGPGVRAFLGKVGEIPSSAPPSVEQEDFILPPPPPSDELVTSPTAFFPPPPPSFGDDILGSPTSSFPPPPPVDFSEAFPPPVEDSFPSPPPFEDSPGEVTVGRDSQVPPPPPAPPMFTPKPAGPPLFSPKPAVPTFSPKPVAPVFSPKPAVPEVSASSVFTKPSVPVFSTKQALPEVSASTVFPKPSVPVFSLKPAVPEVPTSTVSPKPSVPIFSPKPAAPTFVPKPVAHTFVPKPTAPTFVPESPVPKSTPPSAVAPKPTASFAVSPKPSTLFPKQSEPQTFSSPPSAPTPPSSNIFSPKPVGQPSFSPKPPAFTPKSVPSTFSPKPLDTNIDISRPQNRFPLSQPVTKVPPSVTSEAALPPPVPGPGFNFVQQREKPRVLEKPKADTEVPQFETVKSQGPQTENIKSHGLQSNGFRPQPEGFLDTGSKAGGIPVKEPPPKMQKSPEPERAGPHGLNMNEVMELEKLTQQLMKEMDNQRTASTQPMDRCGFCKQGLSRTETIVKAGEHHYHVACFTCSKCDQQLQGRQYYESAGKPLCEDCYEDTLERCAVCDKKITERLLKAMDKAYHPGCFTCAVCHCTLQGVPFIVDDNNQPHCVADYHRRYAPRCSVCGEPIAPEPGRDETVRVFALERNFHMMCYKCEDCGIPLSVEADDSGCFPFNNHVLCKKCYTVQARAAL